MKAALVLGAGQAPVYGDFSEPLPSSGESSVAVTAAAISHVVKSRASGKHYGSSGTSLLWSASTAWVGSMTDVGSISSFRERLTAAWRSEPLSPRHNACHCLMNWMT